MFRLSFIWMCWIDYLFSDFQILLLYWYSSQIWFILSFVSKQERSLSILFFIFHNFSWKSDVFLVFSASEFSCVFSLNLLTSRLSTIYFNLFFWLLFFSTNITFCETFILENFLIFNTTIFSRFCGFKSSSWAVVRMSKLSCWGLFIPLLVSSWLGRSCMNLLGPLMISLLHFWLFHGCVPSSILLRTTWLILLMMVRFEITGNFIWRCVANDTDLLELYLNVFSICNFIK